MRPLKPFLSPTLVFFLGTSLLGLVPAARAQYGASGAAYTQTGNLDNCTSSSVSLNTMAINQFYLYSASGVSVLYSAGVNVPGTNNINLSSPPPAGATIVKAYLEVVEWWSGYACNSAAVSFGGALTGMGVESGQGNFENLWTDPRQGTDKESGNSQYFCNVRYDVTSLVSTGTSSYITDAPVSVAGVLEGLVIVYTVPAPSGCGAVALGDGLFVWGGSTVGSPILDYGVTPWYSTLDWSCQHSQACAANQFSRWGGVSYPNIPVTFTDNFYGDDAPATAEPPSVADGGGSIFQNAGTTDDTFLDTYSNVPLSNPSGKITWGLGTPLNSAEKVYYWVNLLAASCNSICNTPTPTNTPTSTPTPTISSTATSSFTPTNSPTSTFSPTPTNSATFTPSVTVTATWTATSTTTSTATPTPSFTSSFTPTVTDSSTPTASPTDNPTLTSTATSTVTETMTNSATPTDSFTSSPTPTSTATSTPTGTPTQTPTITDSFTVTSTPTVTPTVTNSFTPTFTATWTLTFTPTLTFTVTETPTPTGTSTMTFTFTVTATPTASFTATPTGTPTATPTQTYTHTITFTPTITNTPTPTGTPTPTPLPEPYTVTVGVYNSAGELVKNLLVEKSPQPVTAITLGPENSITSLAGPNNAVSIYWSGDLLTVWNGTNAAGNPVSNGTYYLKVDSVNSLGSDQSVVHEVTVSRTLGTVVAEICNTAGEVVRNLYETDGVGGPITAVQLSSSILHTGSTAQSPMTIGLSNGVTLVWNGTSAGGTMVTNGVYFLEIFSSNGTGGEEVITKDLTVLNSGGPAAGVYAYPNPWQSGDPPLTFKASSAQPLTLKVRLYDLAGERITVFSGFPGTGQAILPSGTPASGVYIAVVELWDSNGDMTARQSLKVMIRR
jgi:hypothetical protein